MFSILFFIDSALVLFHGIPYLPYIIIVLYANNEKNQTKVGRIQM